MARMRTMRWGSLLLSVSLLLMASLLVAVPSSTATNLDSRDSSKNWCTWTFDKGPLPIGCTTGIIPSLIDGRSVAPTDLTSSNPAVATVELVEGGNPWGQYRIEITTVGFGSTEVCYTQKGWGKTPVINDSSVPEGAKPTPERSDQRCHTIQVGQSVQSDCGGSELTPEGFLVGTRHMQLGCTGWSVLGPEAIRTPESPSRRFQRVTDAWSSNQSIVEIWIAPGDSPDVPNQAKFEAVGVGQATICHSWEPRPEVPNDGGPSCWKYTVHPPTVNVRDPRLTRALNEPLINFDPSATSAHFQMGGYTNWDVSEYGPDAVVTSSDPRVFKARPLTGSSPVSLAAHRIGTSTICVEGIKSGVPAKHCIDVTVHPADVNVKGFDLTRNLYTGDVTSAEASTIPVVTTPPSADVVPETAPEVVKRAKDVRVNVSSSDTKIVLTFTGKWNKGQKVQISTKPTSTSASTSKPTTKTVTSHKKGRIAVTVANTPDQQVVVRIKGGRVLAVVNT